MTWKETRARLEYEADHAFSKQHRADIRAALERVEELERTQRTHQVLVNKAVGGMDLGRYEKYTIIRTDKLTELERERDEARAKLAEVEE